MKTDRTLIASALLLVLAALADAGPAAASALTDFERGDYPAARARLEEQIAARPDDANLRLLLGRTLLALGDAAAAVEQFEAAIEIDGLSADAHYWFGAANGTLAASASVFRAGGYARRARSGFGRALELDAEHVAALKGMITYYLEAPRLFGGDRDRARTLIDSLTTIDPLEGALVLADYHTEAGAREQAYAGLRSAAREFPQDPRPALKLGFMTQADEDFDAALGHFQRASEALADAPDARAARHQALYQIGRTAVFSERHIDDGIRAFDAYLMLPPLAGLPDKAWAMFRLGRLHEMAENTGRARELYQQALKSTDDNDLKRLVKQRL